MKGCTRRRSMPAVAHMCCWKGGRKDRGNGARIGRHRTTHLVAIISGIIVCEDALRISYALGSAVFIKQFPSRSVTRWIVGLSCALHPMFRPC
jgi:hypothetical protein